MPKISENFFSSRFKFKSQQSISSKEKRSFIFSEKITAKNLFPLLSAFYLFWFLIFV